MEKLVLRETPAQREVWRRKIQELREDAVGIRRQGEQFDRIVNTNVRHQKERDQLLTRRRQRKEYSNKDEQDLSNLADEAQSWQQSQYMVSDLIGQGEAQLAGLVDQRNRLGGVTRFIGQIGDSLGLSNSTMKIIERRDVTDAYFVLGGCVITSIVIYFVWF
jgi:Golgi SNAP receptor complex protein 2